MPSGAAQEARYPAGTLGDIQAVTKSVSERRSERNRMSDLQSPASDRAPIADTPARSDHAPIADTSARASVSVATNVMQPGKLCSSSTAWNLCLRSTEDSAFFESGSVPGLLFTVLPGGRPGHSVPTGSRWPTAKFRGRGPPRPNFRRVKNEIANKLDFVIRGHMYHHFYCISIPSCQTPCSFVYQ